MNPAIVVVAFQRSDALRRLLRSLGDATYPPGVEVPLAISIDLGDGPGWAETVAAAFSFEWPYGPKAIIQREAHLGVVGHFWAAGKLAGSYGAIILLEDDLVVAPTFYDFASCVLEAYGADERVGGYSLYGLWFNGFTHEPFQPLEDGSDVFFLQLPYTQGLCFNARQWSEFESWSGDSSPRETSRLHPAFRHFGPDEWFPELAAYLAATARYVCFPRVSLTVGWGDAGAHFTRSTSWLQTTVPVRARRYQLSSFDEALAVYDGFFELLPERLRALAPTLRDEDFDVDLNATKKPGNLVFERVLTTRPVRRAIAEYGLEMFPPELNVAWDVRGRGVAFARREDILWDRWAGIEAARRLHLYHWRRHRPSRRRAIRFALARVIAVLRELRR